MSTHLAASLGPQDARELCERGASVIFTGLPHGVEVGIDYASFVVSDKFRGFKMVPPGVHMVFSACVWRWSL